MTTETPLVSPEILLKNKDSARLTVVEHIYHQSPGDPSVPCENRYTKILESSEQPFRRTLEIGEEWTAIPYGWVPHDGCSLLAIVNEVGKRPQVIPTDAEVEEMASRKIIVGIASPSSPTPHTILFSIPYKESSRIPSPSSLKDYLVRSSKGKARYSVYIFPA